MRCYEKVIAAIMAVAVLVGLEPNIDRTDIHGVQCASAQTSEDTMETSAQLSKSATGISTQTPDVTQGVSACDYYQNMSTIGKDTSVVTISNADDLRAYIKIMQKVTGFGLTFVQKSKCYAIYGAEHPSDSGSDETTNGCTDKASGSTGKAPMETHDSTEKISCTARERSPQEDQSRSAVYSGVFAQETKMLFAILP